MTEVTYGVEKDPKRLKLQSC